MRTTVVLSLILIAPLLFAVSPRITFDRTLPAPHGLGDVRDLAIVQAIGDTPKIDDFVALFIDQVNHSGFLQLRDARNTTGPATLHLAVKTFTCETTTGEGEGSTRDIEGKRVKRRMEFADANCVARIDVLSHDMRRISTFYGRGAGTSPRVEKLTEEERDIALQQATRYTAIDAAERITPRRVREIILLDETGPAFDEGMAMIDSGRIAEARAVWERELRKQPRSAALHYNLAAVCEALGDRKAAQQHYVTARQLAPKEERYASEMRSFQRRQ
jgi:tetratricopeptide (TPR) repeat protein